MSLGIITENDAALLFKNKDIIFIPNIPASISVNGGISRTLPSGYEAQEISLIVSGTEPVDIVKISGNDNIIWNNEYKKLIVLSGLEIGQYQVTLRATNIANSVGSDITITFNIINSLVDIHPNLRYRWPFSTSSGVKNTAMATYGTSSFSGSVTDGLAQPAYANYGVSGMSGIASSITLSFWYKVQYVKQYQTIVGVYNSVTNGHSRLYAVSNAVGRYQGGWTGWTKFPSSPTWNATNFPSNRFIHIAVLINSGMTFYYQGSNKGSLSPNGSANTYNNYGMYLGGENTTTDSAAWFKDFRIYNRHLSAAEISEIYNAGIQP
jgi:hypothetical protein